MLGSGSTTWLFSHFRASSQFPWFIVLENNNTFKDQRDRYLCMYLKQKINFILESTAQEKTWEIVMNKADLLIFIIPGNKELGE